MVNSFDLVAPVYLRVDEHWGSDLDLLKAAVVGTLPRRPKIRYLDVGCGTGFHLTFVKYLYPELYVTGIDPSSGMLEEAYRSMNRIGCYDASLVQSDIGQFWSPMRFNIVSFLNNGLGNLYTESEKPAALRERAIRKIHSLMPGGDLFVVSVYNLEKFDLKYGTDLILTKREDAAGDFHFEYRSNHHPDTPIEFYTHWFTEKELVGLLEQNGFKVELLEKRMARIVVLARAV